MPERRGVGVAELGDGERLRGEREADVGVGELGLQPVAGRADDRAVVERGPRQGVQASTMPICSEL